MNGFRDCDFGSRNSGLRYYACFISCSSGLFHAWQVDTCCLCRGRCEAGIESGANLPKRWLVSVVAVGNLAGVFDRIQDTAGVRRLHAAECEAPRNTRTALACPLVTLVTFVKRGPRFHAFCRDALYLITHDVGCLRKKSGLFCGRCRSSWREALQLGPSESRLIFRMLRNDAAH